MKMKKVKQKLCFMRARTVIITAGLLSEFPFLFICCNMARTWRRK
jgi:hypothetical protein